MGKQGENTAQYSAIAKRYAYCTVLLAISVYSPCYPFFKAVKTVRLLRNTEECHIDSLVDWDRVANSRSAVANKLCGLRVTLSVDGLSVAALGSVGCVLLGGESENVRPLLHGLGVYWENQYNILE